MARIRTIKPEYFRHEVLQDLERNNPGKYPMLVFAGLWTLSDKAGRFEWRPRQIKLDILPFLDFDMDETLSILSEANFIQKYEVNGKDYGLIPSFKDHQRINGKELQSPEKYPEPLENQKGSTGEAHGKQPRSQERKGKGKERNGYNKTSLPENFEISDRVRKWAVEKKHNHLEEHLESFKLKCTSKDYKYKDWDAAFMNAIRDNWAKIDNTVQSREPPSSVISCQKCGARCLKSDLVDDGCIYCMNQEAAQ